MAFNNAHNFTVNGLNLTHAHNLIVNDPVSTTLWQHVAPGAIFNSAERFPPAKCHPGTRERIIEKITTWIENPDPTQRILWLYGPAGSGKSALAHTICERHRDQCGGSFFFARGPTDRGKSFKLFATLSYQLAIQLPSFRTVLNEALQHDPSLPTKSMEDQLFSLIIQPLMHCPSFPDSGPILIIDGLDECADDQGPDTHSHIIMLIAQALVEHDIPVRFLIASRPESWIRDTFESSPPSDITLSLSLRDDIDADKDIKRYLTEGFEKIYVAKKRIMGEVALPWPSAEIVERFVYEASGQYIYAEILLKFVGRSSRYDNPLLQLHILTTPGPDRALAFSELDRLFVTVLAAYPRWPTMKRVLEGILVDANSTIIEKILGVDRSELALVLDALSPLIDITLPQPLSRYEKMLEPIYGPLAVLQEEIKISHLSFREFLQDKTRSGDFHVDIGNVREEMRKTLFGIIHHNIDQNYATEPHLSWNIGLATYSHMLRTMIKHITGPDAHPIRQMIIATTHRLQLLDHDLSMEHPGCFMADMELLSSYCTSIAFNSRQSFTSTGQVQIVLELKDAISLARKRCIHQLSSYRRFTVTPTLAYLYRFPSKNVDILFDIGPTVADVVSTIQQHRHIIIPYSWDTKPYTLYHVSLHEDLEKPRAGDSDWYFQGEWKYQCISFMSHRLYEVLHDVNNMQCHTFRGRTFRKSHISFHDLVHFFSSSNISDICSREYFQHPCNLSILAMMTDYSAWTAWRELADDCFIVPVLCWFNRQLTNSTALNLLEDHNEILVCKMKLAMNKIFEHHYLPQFHIPDICHNIIGYPDGVRDLRFVKFIILPLFQGASLEKVHYVAEEGELYMSNLRECSMHFHDEVFGTKHQTRDGPPLIDHQRWHPHFACYLLDSSARLMWGSTTERSQGPHAFFFNKEFPYILHCLPYAETTQQNLHSLRTIAYFFPDSTSRTSLDRHSLMEFYSSSMEFLKKYDRSILSEEELREFEKRLRPEALPSES